MKKNHTVEKLLSIDEQRLPEMVFSIFVILISRLMKILIQFKRDIFRTDLVLTDGWQRFDRSIHITTSFNRRRLLEEVPLDIRQDTWYLHNGAPSCNALLEQTWFNQKFPDK
ncbi:hypothetical protein BDFB_014838 [Asbolus verrucosus]|uniref:DDE 3 domain containing protein n=1 Tax=Asbolus verrucosus TaxID=1661398 RepID=A0A482VBF4_ASBVE|nr:hypothetical protein BDFB_014838 [Asbolus verrucosus]